MWEDYKMRRDMEEVRVNNILGTMNYSNGDVYDGYWKEDIKDGEGNVLHLICIGKFTSIDGSKYDGSWRNNQITGHGKINY